MLDGLAFLPVDLVPDGMAYVREVAPEALGCIVDYFDATYVSGAYRTVLGNGRLRFRRTPPRFEPSVWNVHEVTINDAERTNNACESWNNGFLSLVGHCHPSLWVAISCLQKDNAETETEAYRVANGQPSKRRRKKNAVRHQALLKKMCLRLTSGEYSVPDFLQAIGRCVRLDRA